MEVVRWFLDLDFNEWDHLIYQQRNQLPMLDFLYPAQHQIDRLHYGYSPNLSPIAANHAIKCYQLASHVHVSSSNKIVINFWTLEAQSRMSLISRALADVNLVACYFRRRLQHQRDTKGFVRSVTIFRGTESAVSIVIKPLGATLGICGVANDEEEAEGGVERRDLVGAGLCSRIFCSKIFSSVF